MQQLDGIIIKGIGGFYYVEVAETVYECKARGIFRKNKIMPYPGDYVRITVQDDSENTIDEIKERKSLLTRPTVANLDKLFIITSVCDPNPNTLVIDKLTAIATRHELEAVIVITKSDLKSADSLSDIYTAAGFKVIVSSGKTGEGMERIETEMQGHISALTGNTGVGKSTILNCIYPDLGLQTGEISEKLGRGRHTTRHVELFKTESGYIADTPGFSSLDIENGEVILKDELPFCFPEFVPYLGTCKFSTCTHVHDKGCKIAEAVQEGKIPVSRHENYIAMYNEVKDIKTWEL